LPVLHDRAQTCKRGGGIDPSEELTDHSCIGRFDAQTRELRHQRHPLPLGRILDGHERQPSPLDVNLMLALRGDHHLMPRANARVSERDEGQEVARTSPSSHENPHRPHCNSTPTGPRYGEPVSLGTGDLTARARRASCGDDRDLLPLRHAICARRRMKARSPARPE